MPSRADDYRRRAQEAEEEARRVTDPLARAELEAIARRWRELAERVEREPF